MPEELIEARATLLAEAVAGTPGRYRVQIINPGWGSSGYYSEAVLSEAATRQVFSAGLKMYADHPHADGSGIDETGNRSVTDIWGKLLTDATVAADGALVAEVQVRPDIAPVVDFLADAIGLSIRGMGSFEVGEAEGRKGRLVTSLDEALSVDFVVDAGRGGQILALIESAAGSPLGEAMSNDIRDAISSAVDDTYGTVPDVYCWLRDYDAESGLAYFDICGPADNAGTYSQAYTIGEDGAATLDGEKTEVVRKTEYVPVTTTEAAAPPPPDANPAETPASTEETHMSESSAEGAAPAGTTRAVIERELAEQRRAVAILQAQDRARVIVTEVLAEAIDWVAPLTIIRVTGELLESSRLPLVDNKLDETALRNLATAARDQAEREAGQMLESAGLGRPRGLSSIAPTGDGGGSARDEQRLEESLRELGMSETAAATAAKGR